MFLHEKLKVYDKALVSMANLARCECGVRLLGRIASMLHRLSLSQEIAHGYLTSYSTKFTIMFATKELTEARKMSKLQREGFLTLPNQYAKPFRLSGTGLRGSGNPRSLALSFTGRRRKALRV